MNLPQRVMLGTVAILAGVGLAAEGDVMFAWMLAKGMTLPVALIRYFSFFTVLTNGLVAIYGAFCVCGGERRWGSRQFHASLKTCLAVSIFFVGADYFVLLRHVFHFTGVGMYANDTLHYVVPTLFVLYWIVFASRQVVPWVHACWWTLYPVLYFVFTLILGWRTGLYPYPFINVTRIGYQHTFFNGGVLLVLYFVGALFFIGLARWRLRQGEKVRLLS